jgi:Icc protein
MIIVQISDPHIDYSDLASQNRLKEVLSQINNMPTSPDLLIITGDCTEHGHPDEYRLFQELIAPNKMPTFFIPGNHDNRQMFREILGVPGHNHYAEYVQYTIEDQGPLRLIALDTLIPGKGKGTLSSGQLAWLDTQLAAQPDRPTMLMMHHPPLKTGLKVLDNMGLECYDHLAAILQRHKQVELIAAGHFHGHYQQRFANTSTIVCPSTLHQWNPDFRQPERFVVQYQTPSCLIHIWNNDIGLLSYPCQLTDNGPYTMLNDGQNWIPQVQNE